MEQTKVDRDSWVFTVFLFFILTFIENYSKINQEIETSFFFFSIFSGAKQTEKKISWPTNTYGKSIHLIRLKHFLQTNWNFETLEYQYQSIAQTKWKTQRLTYSRNYKNCSLAFLYKNFGVWWVMVVSIWNPWLWIMKAVWL